MHQSLSGKIIRQYRYTTSGHGSLVQGAQVIGAQNTWALVSADKIRPDGARQHDYGEAPSGLLMIDNDGRYTLQIYQHGRPHFSGGDKKNGTAQEFRAAVGGSSTHYRVAARPDGHVPLSVWPRVR
ncbi:MULTISPECIES: lipocalin-like domain-containing protein [unclassified Duganella]|uniref:lipocalin-like domain-containing protein n=1 Tax=Duganella sp. CF402 TaxID=1855289 RepID=UPI000B82AE87